MIEPSSDAILSASPLSNYLTYSIFEGVLVGRIDGTYVSCKALTGGGGASKGKITDSTVVNNPYSWGKKRTSVEKAAQRGGPIPPGVYSVAKPEKIKSINGIGARLTPTGQTATLLKKINRGGFLIHGAGYYGSDGCIVPPNTAEFRELMTLLEKSAPITLLVLENLGSDRFA